jgi:hypothetical protein
MSDKAPFLPRHVISNLDNTRELQLPKTVSNKHFKAHRAIVAARDSRSSLELEKRPAYWR